MWTHNICMWLSVHWTVHFMCALVKVCLIWESICILVYGMILEIDPYHHWSQRHPLLSSLSPFLFLSSLAPIHDHIPSLLYLMFQSSSQTLTATSIHENSSRTLPFEKIFQFWFRITVLYNCHIKPVHHISKYTESHAYFNSHIAFHSGLSKNCT